MRTSGLAWPGAAFALVAATFAVSICLWANGARAQETIGTVKRVEGRPSVVRGSAGMVAVVGMALQSGDVLRTGPGEGIGLLMADDTSFTVGERAEIVLDRFIYDPARSAAAFTARVAKGSFKYLSGQVARIAPDSVRLALPVSTIGVRGTHVAGRVCTEGDPACAYVAARDDGSFRMLSGEELLTGTIKPLASDPEAGRSVREVVVLLPDPDGTVGRIRVSTAAGVRVLEEGSTATLVYGANRVPSEPFPVREGAIGSFLDMAARTAPESPSRFTFLFETGTTNFVPESDVVARRVASELARREHREIFVVGHADAVGGDAANVALSRARAEAVRAILVRAGIDARAIRILFRGAAEPAVPTAAGVADVRNRRVEVSVR
ncbi:MAG: OmpA family protein [Alphaproteobacteria bacterium]|nr:OmpA family protein [Alphaproteobacteria bacterium]